MASIFSLRLSAHPGFDQRAHGDGCAQAFIPVVERQVEIGRPGHRRRHAFRPPAGLPAPTVGSPATSRLVSTRRSGRGMPRGRSCPAPTMPTGEASMPSSSLIATPIRLLPISSPRIRSPLGVDLDPLRWHGIRSRAHSELASIDTDSTPPTSPLARHPRGSRRPGRLQILDSRAVDRGHLLDGQRHLNEGAAGVAVNRHRRTGNSPRRDRASFPRDR